MDKNTGYKPWISAFQSKVKAICVIGEASDKIESELSPHYPVKRFCSLQEAVEGATLLASKGDIVLLSPGCASTDMFKDYADRGNKFIDIINELTGKHES